MEKLDEVSRSKEHSEQHPSRSILEAHAEPISKSETSKGGVSEEGQSLGAHNCDILEFLPGIL